MLNPILQMIHQPTTDTSGNITPYVPPVGIEKSIFTDETDLDFFMYKQGINL